MRKHSTFVYVICIFSVVFFTWLLVWGYLEHLEFKRKNRGVFITEKDISEIWDLKWKAVNSLWKS